jgi:hypothetical protein
LNAVIPFILHLGTTGLGIAIFATMYWDLSALSKAGMILKLMMNFFIIIQFMFFHRAWVWNLAHMITIALYTVGRFPAGGGRGILTRLDRAFIYYGFIVHGILIWFSPLVMKMLKSYMSSEYLATFDPGWTSRKQSWLLKLIA